MKVCRDCNVEMMEATYYGYPRFIDMDHEIDRFEIRIKTGEKKSFLGIKYDSVIKAKLKARVCPNCGKVENYIDKEDLIKE